MEDAIKTSQGKVGITFADDTRVQVNENSKLIIDDFVYDPKKPGASKLALNMAAGTVRYASGAIAHNNPGRVAINTPTATIAVRGTDFTATVDELGASTIILLPSCPYGNIIDIEKECKTGVIDVSTDAGIVTLSIAFQATRVESRSLSPTKPVVINLSLDAMNNMMILSPPAELRQYHVDQRMAKQYSILNQDLLKEADLGNVLTEQQSQIFNNKLAMNFLDQTFLYNILTMLNEELAAEMNMLNNTQPGLLPDYRASTGVKVYVDDASVILKRDDSSNRQSITVPRSETATIYQIQGNTTIKNRVNSGSGTVITLRQN